MYLNGFSNKASCSLLKSRMLLCICQALFALFLANAVFPRGRLARTGRTISSLSPVLPKRYKHRVSKLTFLQYDKYTRISHVTRLESLTKDLTNFRCIFYERITSDSTKINHLNVLLSDGRKPVIDIIGSYYATSKLQSELSLGTKTYSILLHLLLPYLFLFRISCFHAFVFFLYIF